MWKRERVTGIEPAFSAWEADVLPLNYTRVKCPSPTNILLSASVTPQSRSVQPGRDLGVTYT